MRLQTNAALILGVAIVIAALLFVLGPSLWTDHVWDSNKPTPSGCTMLVSPLTFVTVHCPVWVKY